MDDFYNQFENLLKEYDSKLSIPNWFISGVKTLLDRNITIEDWNRMYSYLSRMASDNEVLYKMLLLIKNDYVSKTKDETIHGSKQFTGDVNHYGSLNIEKNGYFQAPVESTSINGTPTEEWQIVNKKHLDKQLEFKVNVDVFQFEKQAISNSLNKKADTIYVDAEISHTMTYVDAKFNQILGEGASETLDTIGEISKALEENIDVVEALDNAITNKADKKEITRLDNILSELNIYDYLVYNNPEVKGNTLYLDNAYVSDGVLYLKNAKVENGVLYIDYIE